MGAMPMSTDWIRRIAEENKKKREDEERQEHAEKERRRQFDRGADALWTEVTAELALAVENFNNASGVKVVTLNHAGESMKLSRTRKSLDITLDRNRQDIQVRHSPPLPGMDGPERRFAIKLGDRGAVIQPSGYPELSIDTFLEQVLAGFFKD